LFHADARSERPRDPSWDRTLDAGPRSMHVRAAPGPGPGRVHLGGAIGPPYHPDEGGPGRRGVAPGAGPQRDV